MSVEILAELVRAISNEHPLFYVETPRGQVGAWSWDGARNEYGDLFSSGKIVMHRSLAVQTALAAAERLLGKVGQEV